MTTHTPGPWCVNGSAIEQVETPGRKLTWSLAHVAGPEDNGPQEWEANARLIAAAPDMRDALHGMMLACYGVLNSCKDLHNNVPEKYRLEASAALLAASKALDKAEGR